MILILNSQVDSCKSVMCYMLLWELAYRLWADGRNERNVINRKSEVCRYSREHEQRDPRSKQNVKHK